MARIRGRSQTENKDQGMDSHYGSRGFVNSKQTKEYVHSKKSILLEERTFKTPEDS